jgi:cyclopropane fatty-acyl-phospholipid synthase-like methyltransferase
MSARQTSSAPFFEAKYQQDADPWGFAENTAELRRYRSTMEALGNRRYKRAFEPGCSIGVLTQMLAGVCDSIVALDLSITAVGQARRRCADLAHVYISCGGLAEQLSFSGFDLVVLSEIGYYFTIPELRSLCSRLIEPMEAGSTLLAVHWLGDSADHILSGDQVHDVLSQFSALDLEYSGRHSTFRIDRWTRNRGSAE